MDQPSTGSSPGSADAPSNDSAGFRSSRSSIGPEFPPGSVLVSWRAFAATVVLAAVVGALLAVAVMLLRRSQLADGKKSVTARRLPCVRSPVLRKVENMPTQFLAGLLVSFACLGATRAHSPFDQELTERRQRFAAEAARPGSAAAVVPLLGLSDLWDDVVDRTTLREASTDATKPRPTVHELVRAEALWHDQMLRRHAGDDAGRAMPSVSLDF